MEIKVGKVELGITANGTPKVMIYPEKSDFNNTSEAIEIIGELESIYTLTRKIGEPLEITQKGKWKNLVVPDEYTKAFTSSGYDRVKTLFKSSLLSLNKVINGTRSSIDLETAKVLFTDILDINLKTQDFVLGLLKKDKSELAKIISDGVKSENADIRYSSWKMLLDLSNKVLNETNKDYTILNDFKEKK